MRTISPPKSSSSSPAPAPASASSMSSATAAKPEKPPFALPLSGASSTSAGAPLAGLAVSPAFSLCDRPERADQRLHSCRIGRARGGDRPEVVVVLLLGLFAFIFGCHCDEERFDLMQEERESERDAS